MNAVARESVRSTLIPGPQHRSTAMSATSAPTCCHWRKAATVVAVFAIGGLIGWMARGQKTAVPEPEMVEVLVATQDLPVGLLLDQKDLSRIATKTRLPRKDLPKDSITAEGN